MDYIYAELNDDIRDTYYTGYLPENPDEESIGVVVNIDNQTHKISADLSEATKELLAIHEAAIAEEITRAKAAEEQLGSDLEFETAARVEADEDLSESLSTEVTDRKAADAAIIERLDTAEDEIDDLKNRAAAVEGRATTIEGKVAALEAKPFDTYATKTEVNTVSERAELGITNAKTAQDEVDALEGVVSTLSGEYTVTKALATTNEAAIGALDTRVGTVEGKVSTLETESAKHALKSDVETELAKKVNVSDYETYQSTVTEALNSRYTKSEVDNKFETLNNVVSSEQSKLNTLTTRVNTAEGNITTLHGIVETGTDSNANLRGAITELQTLTGADGAIRQEIAANIAAIETEASNRASAISAEVAARELLAGRVKTLEDVDNATQAELDAYKEVVTGDIATAKSDAITDAKSYADGLAGNYDAAGSASAAQIAAITSANSYTDEKVSDLENGQVKTNTEAIATLSGTVTSEIERVESLVSTEAADRKNADNAIIERLEPVEAFFKTAEGETLDGALDTLKEIQDYLNGEGEAAGGIIDRIAQAETDIDNLQEEFNTETGRVTVAEGKITALEGKVSTLEIESAKHAEKTYVDEELAKKVNVTDYTTAIGNVYTKAEADGKFGLKTVVENNTTNINTNASNITTLTGRLDTAESDIEAVENRATAIEGRATTIEGKVSTLETESAKHAEKTYVDEELAKKVNINSLATVATTGSYNDLIDKPTINGVEITGAKTSADLQLGMQTGSGGFQGGYGATVGIGTGAAVGMNASATHGGAIGYLASATSGFAGGMGANSSYASDGETKISGAVAIGANANAQADYAIQLGTGTNTEEDTLQFRDYQLLDADGKIPEARLADTYLPLTAGSDKALTGDLYVNSTIYQNGEQVANKSDIPETPTINGVAVEGAKTSADLKLGEVTTEGGFQAGTDAEAYEGGAAIGNSARAASAGGAVGYKAHAASGGAVGHLAEASTGGAVGSEANTTDGGAVGTAASAASGGAVGSSARAHTGGAVGSGANASAGGAVGYKAHTMSGGAIGREAAAAHGGAVGTEAVAADGGAIGYSAFTESGGAVGYLAEADAGGAVGYSASASTGGAVGSQAKESAGGGAVGTSACANEGGAVGYNASASTGGAIGQNAATAEGGAVGYSASASTGGAIGLQAKTYNGFAGGENAQSLFAPNGITILDGAVAIGRDAKAQADGAVQLGTGTNTNKETLQFRDYQLLDADGKIPADRLPEASTGGVTSVNGRTGDVTGLVEKEDLYGLYSLKFYSGNDEIYDAVVIDSKLAALAKSGLPNGFTLRAIISYSTDLITIKSLAIRFLETEDSANYEAASRFPVCLATGTIVETNQYSTNTVLFLVFNATTNSFYVTGDFGLEAEVEKLPRAAHNYLDSADLTGEAHFKAAGTWSYISAENGIPTAHPFKLIVRGPHMAIVPTADGTDMIWQFWYYATVLDSVGDQYVQTFQVNTLQSEIEKLDAETLSNLDFMDIPSLGIGTNVKSDWKQFATGNSSSYNDLSDKPAINGVELTGTKTGTDLKLGEVTNQGGFKAGSAAAAQSGAAIGLRAYATTGGAVGYQAYANSGGGAVGYSAKVSSGGAVGSGASASTGFAGGYSAKARYAADGSTELSGAVAVGDQAVAQANNAIQLGTGTNTNEGTLQFRTYQLVDSNGKIPTDRLLAYNLYTLEFFASNDELYDTIIEDSKLAALAKSGLPSGFTLRVLTPDALFIRDLALRFLKVKDSAEEYNAATAYPVCLATGAVVKTTQYPANTVLSLVFDANTNSFHVVGDFGLEAEVEKLPSAAHPYAGSSINLSGDTHFNRGAGTWSYMTATDGVPTAHPLKLIIRGPHLATDVPTSDGTGTMWQFWYYATVLDSVGNQYVQTLQINILQSDLAEIPGEELVQLLKNPIDILELGIGTKVKSEWKQVITNIGHKTFYRGTDGAQNTVEIHSTDYDALAVKSISQENSYTAVSNGYVWIQANENDAARVSATDLMYWTGEGDAATSGTIPWSSLADCVSLSSVLPYLASFAPDVNYTSVTQLYKILGVETEFDGGDYDLSDTKEVGQGSEDYIDASAVFYTPGAIWPSSLGTPHELEQLLKTKPCIFTSCQAADSAWKGSILVYRESVHADYGLGTQLYDLWDKYGYDSQRVTWTHDDTTSAGIITIATNSIVTHPIYKQPTPAFNYDPSTKILIIS